MKLNDCIGNTTAVRGNVATVTSYCNYCSVMQDIILRVIKSEFSRTILCLSSLSGKYVALCDPQVSLAGPKWVKLHKNHEFSGKMHPDTPQTACLTCIRPLNSVTNVIFHNMTLHHQLPQ